MIRRRTFLGSAAIAGLMTACAGAPPDFGDVTGQWPALGRMIETPDGTVHAWDRGEGQPVIMLHGASGNLRDWTYHLAPRIAEHRWAIAFDRPGFGYSERRMDRAGDPAVQARTLKAAADAMGVERPILIGHSWGAAVAMAWALAHPNDVAGIIPVSGAVMPWSHKPALVEMIGVDGLLIGLYFDYLQASAGSRGIERFVRRIFRPQTPPPDYIDYVGGPLALRDETLAANREDIESLNTALRRMAPDYGRLRMPVEVISGTADPIIRPDRQPIPLTQRLPNARLTLLDNVGHMAHQAAPEQVLAALDRLDLADA